MKWVEKLNIVTGFILMAVGIINFTQSVYTMGFSWLIFGSMCLVMDSHKVLQPKQKFEVRATWLRKIFSLIGLIASIALFVYTANQF